MKTEKILKAIIDGHKESAYCTMFSATAMFDIAEEALGNATKNQIRDMNSFIDWGHQNYKSAPWISGNLWYDLVGIKGRQRGFSPRSKGYCKSQL